MPGAEDRVKGLLHDATVWIRGPETGGRSGDPQLWGSGFFIAPGRVLTCAHVLADAPAGSGVWQGKPNLRITYRVRPEHHDGSPEATVAGRLLYSLPAHDPAVPLDRGSWPLPDLAVIAVDEEYEHPCVWLSDLSTPPGGASGQLGYRGFRIDGGSVRGRSGDCAVEGTDEPYGVRLGIEGGEIKPGLSGGPVVDLGRGAVVAVVKGRRNDGSGGTSVQITALRELWSPGGDGQPYQELIRSHDRWHWTVYQRDRDVTRTWAGEQSKLPNTSGDWRPEDRVEALGLLAGLPPAPDSGTVQRLVDKACPGQFELRMPPPVSWRDGAGLLYDPVRKSETEAVLDYLLRVAGSVQDVARTAALALQDWALERAELRPELVRSDLGRLAVVRERVGVSASRAGAAGHTGREAVGLWPAPAPDPPPGDSTSAFREEPAPDTADADPAEPPVIEAAAVLLELRDDWWLEDHYHWTVRLVGPTGEAELVGVGEDLAVTDLVQPPQEVVDALNRAFLRADAGCYVAPFEVLVAQELFDLPFDAWRVNGPSAHESESAGCVRPVSIIDQRRHGPYPLERSAVRRVSGPPHAAGPHPRMLPLLEAHVASPAPDVVLFHRGPVRDGAAGAALRDALNRGFTTVVWSRAEATLEQGEQMTEGVRRMLDRISSPAEVPAAVTALRANHAALPARDHWSRHLAVLHHDPDHRPVPADLLDAP
ncbi:trypsin-like peptidase domain-containing protein [Streptomyces sp. FXY-T5]|uniref:VMAP-C domain-containing protein n=1 Tax=Streptomyces sp. FXY-T5 TaxID=3064901 RepID=UPI0027D235CC|nr:trypsin-like peptidase domain-containing protein [Streptomyces sp. FXY-T5]WMD04102.1 trypsin-like peptidase domain-containing protein [Streptomyces sp. FXY-T5]